MAGLSEIWLIGNNKMTHEASLKHIAAAQARIDALSMNANFAELLAQKAAALGDKIAVDFFQSGEKISYADLHEKTDKLADALMRMGVRKGTHVALVTPNSSGFVLSWFAIAKIGAVMVPVNPSYTVRELIYVLSDSDASFLVYDPMFAAVVEAVADDSVNISPERMIVLGEKGDKPGHAFAEVVASGRSPFVPPVSVQASDLLSIQYTSGTTGSPKGCMQSQDYWLRLSLVAANFQLLTLENILVTFPMFYLDPQLQLLMALRGNGTAFIAAQHSLSKFRDWIRDYHIHVATITPPVFRAMPETAEDGDNDLRYISAFYHKEDTHAALEKRFNCVGRDAFGMTEVGVALYTPVAATHKVGAGTVGLAAPYREIMIADEQGNEMPRGEAGELCIAGDGLFWGYYKKPEANRESFRGKWFRTGDVATMDAEGYVSIVGRLKEMIKRSGENIAAIEVQEVLAEHEAIVEAAVIGVPDPMRNEEVKAYILLAEGQTPETVPPQAIQAHCLERLSKFKVPRYISYVDDFPRTPSNKIAKSKLTAGVDDLKKGAFDLLENKAH
jgi:acyl-CoA synthetase (AMP-forming)/AMP-acid ligase II